MIVATSRGRVHRLLEELYTRRNISGEFAEIKRKIIVTQLSLKTGVSMAKFGPTSEDDAAEVERIKTALRQPEFRLTDYSWLASY